jgi:ketosteroid isomerase-like protein
MRARTRGVVRSVVIVMALLVGWTHPAFGQPAGDDSEAIQQVLQKYVSVINSPEFAKGPRDRRVEMLRPFYRPDKTLSRTDLPLFFGPLSDPVARGVDAHLENTSLNFEYLFRQQMTYGLRIDELQVEVGTGMATALALTTSGYSSADGKTNYVTRGRATIVFNKMKNGDWLITHEQSELYNNTNPAILSKQQLTTAIEKLPK